ncbi:MAG: hypothetical protein J1F40_09850 [Prevotellaceae bacterium]|nr:hypothetical protein [Prevotellaceae bacterium]
MGFKDFSKSWMGKIASGFVGLVGLTSGLIAIVQLFMPTDGQFLAILNNKEVVPPITRHLLIYMDKDSVDINPLQLLPQFSNPTKYPVEDLLLTYNVSYQNANVKYTDYYTIHHVANGEEARNLEKTLYPLADQPDAFMAFVMRNQSKADVKIRATYKGVDNPFEYEVSLMAKRVWNSDSILRAKAVMEDAYMYTATNSIDSVDIYVLDGEKVASYTGTSASILQYAHNATSTVAQQNSATPPSSTTTTTKSEPVAETVNTAENSQPQPVVKTVSQIKKETKETIQEAKEEYETPWYVTAIQALLAIIGGLGFAFAMCISMLIFESEDKKELRQGIIWFVALITIAYLSYYGYKVFFVGMMRPFFIGLGEFFIISIGMALFISAFAYLDDKSERANTVLMKIGLFILKGLSFIAFMAFLYWGFIFIVS